VALLLARPNPGSFSLNVVLTGWIFFPAKHTITHTLYRCPFVNVWALFFVFVEIRCCFPLFILYPAAPVFLCLKNDMENPSCPIPLTFHDQ
jgi:hypothetical protein